MDSVFDAMNNRSVADLPCYKRIGHAVMGYSLDPHSQFHTVWDLWVLVLVIVSSMWAPYKVAFLPGQGMGWFEVVMDVCFYVDIIITFWTGFDKCYEIVHDKKQARHSPAPRPTLPGSSPVLARACPGDGWAAAPCACEACAARA